MIDKNSMEDVWKNYYTLNDRWNANYFRVNTTLFERGGRERHREKYDFRINSATIVSEPKNIQFIATIRLEFVANCAYCVRHRLIQLIRSDLARLVISPDRYVFSIEIPIFSNKIQINLKESHKSHKIRLHDIKSSY